MIEVLLLGRQHGYPRLEAVVEKALAMNCFDVEAVRLLLDAERNKKRELREAVEVGALRMYDRPQPTTRNYDQLLGSYSVREVLQ